MLGDFSLGKVFLVKTDKLNKEIKVLKKGIKTY